MVKVIASGVRKGNVIEHEDGKLYVVLKSESMHPGKGTPTTTIDMRRISDGVKTVVRYKTTDAMERAFRANGLAEVDSWISPVNRQGARITDEVS